MTRPLRSALSCLVPALALLLLAAASASAQVAPPATGAGPSFKSLDTNRNGRVSLEEVMAYAKKKSTQVQPFRLADVDLDGDGMLTPEELQKAGVKDLDGQGAISARDLDINGDGYVSREDLDEYFRRKHRAEFARADADKDAWLKESEFALFRF